VRLLPGREFPMDEAARTAFRARWRERIEGDPTKARVYKDVGQGIATAGIEYYLPLFFDETATFFSYLRQEAALVLHGEVDAALERYWSDTRDRHRFLQHDPERPILPPEALFLRPEDFFTLTQPHATLSLRGSEPVEWARPLPDVSVDRGATEPLHALEAPDVSPCAAGGRERRPAREPAGDAARPPHRRAQRGFAAGLHRR
jgi:transcription-repair coupling factor (superfamily II helicase)